MSTTLPNLDRLAAQHAQNIINRTKATKAGDVDNMITNALGVLQENGVYACILYLKAKEKDNGDAVVEEVLNLLDGIGFGWGKPVKDGKVDTGAEAVLKHITDKVTVNLERLLWAKATLEQMLIYARYGAKARESGGTVFDGMARVSRRLSTAHSAARWVGQSGQHAAHACLYDGASLLGCADYAADARRSQGAGNRIANVWKGRPTGA